MEMKSMNPSVHPMKTKTVNFIIVILLGIVFSTEFSHADIRRIWAVDDSEKIKREDISNPLATSPDNAVWNGTTVSLFGCRNEIVAFQLMLEGDASGQAGMDVRITDLGNGIDTIPGSQAGSPDPFDYRGKSIELFTEHYLNITSKSPPGWFYHPSSPPSDYYLGWVPDALIPLAAIPGRGGAPFSVPANQNQGVWVDVYIPRNVSAGIYTGSIEVLVNSVVVQTIPISLQVYAFIMPDETHLQNMFAYSSWDGLCLYAHGHNDDYSNWFYENLDIKYRQMAHRHRMTLTRAIINLERMSSYDVKYLNGEAFTAANQYAGPGEGTGDSSFCIGPYGYRPYEWGGNGGTQAQYWAGTNAWEQWFRDNSPGVYRFHQVAPDEPQTPEQYEQVRTECNWMHNNPGIGSNIPCMVTHEVIAELQGYIDFWCFWGMGLLPGNVNLPGIEQEKSAGNKIGVYNGGRPSMGTVLIDSDAVDFRVIPWVFKKYGISFYFYWETIYWNEVNCFQDPRTFARAYNGDGTFFYPGQCVAYPAEDRGLQGPLSSIRMKNWRRGQQDFEYIWLAEQYGLQNEANQIINNCIPRAAWEAVPAENISWPQHGYGFELYRKQMAELINSATGQFFISGSVTHNGSGLANVVLNGLPGNPITDGNGRYSASVESGWSGTVTPELAGHTFTPFNRSFNNVTSNQTSQDFTASDGSSQIQTISLVSGWNWISFQVFPEDTSLDSVFSGIAGQVEQVRTQTQSALRLNGNWIGDLSDMAGIGQGIMYKVRVSAPCTLTAEGTIINPSLPISMTSGWNWVGYLPASSQGLSQSLSSIQSQTQQVKSQTHSAVYLNDQWLGDLQQMEPGKGYTILMNGAGTLQWPSIN